MRDDLKNLPLPKEARAYARRSGMSALKRQPQQFINMVAAVTDQKSKKHGFKNTDEVGRVPSAIKECARLIVAQLVETDEEDPGYREFRVYPDESFLTAETEPTSMDYNFEVPQGNQIYINKLRLKIPFEANAQQQVEARMALLAKTRNYPDGSFFVAPWGTYLIHGGTVGKL